MIQIETVLRLCRQWVCKTLEDFNKKLAEGSYHLTSSLYLLINSGHDKVFSGSQVSLSAEYPFQRIK